MWTCGVKVLCGLLLLGMCQPRSGWSATDQIVIPLHTWIARPVPRQGQGPSGPMKHMRLAHNPVNGRIYFEGGDYRGPTGMDSGRNETYSYSIKDGDWQLEYPYCAPAGELQPSHPDEVGWVYDTKRNLFWMVPGYMGGAGAGTADNGKCPQSPSTMIRSDLMSFDPVTRKWDFPRRKSSASIGLIPGNQRFAQYDPGTDTIIQFGYDNLPFVAIYDLQADTWTKKRFTGNARLGWEYSAIDVEKRLIYVIEPSERSRSKLYRVKIDTKEFTLLCDAPQATFKQAQPVWDSVNKVLLWFADRYDEHIEQVGKFHVYHPETNTWEEDRPMHQPEGLIVRGNHVVFDPYQNVLLLMGGLYPSANPYLFLYRYGNGVKKRGGDGS